MSLSGYGTARPGVRSGPTTILSPFGRRGRAPEVMSAARPARHTAAVETGTRSRGPLVVAVLAAVLHLVVGVYYLAGGLLIPGYVLVPLWAVWILLAWWLVTLARRNSWWTMIAPVAAAVLFLVVVTVGEQVLGWRG